MRSLLYVAIVLGIASCSEKEQVSATEGAPRDAGPSPATENGSSDDDEGGERDASSPETQPTLPASQTEPDSSSPNGGAPASGGRPGNEGPAGNGGTAGADSSPSTGGTTATGGTSATGGTPSVGMAGATTDPAGGGGGQAETGMCEEGYLRCGDVCIDPMTDPVHCGARDECAGPDTSGRNCQAINALCEGGACVPCAEPLVACGGACIDPVSDSLYCGASAGCSPSTDTRGDRCWTPDQCISGACAECVTFANRTKQVPTYPQQLAMGDVTSDGALDVVTVNREGSLLVMPGGTALTIGEPLLRPFGVDFVGLGLGFLDADAQLDVLMGDVSAGVVMVALGNGDGSFELGQTYDVEGLPRRIKLATIDDDESVDAFVIGQDATGLVVLFGGGDGTFEIGPTIAWPDSLYDVATGDLNGDGATDAVVVGVGEEALILQGDGQGGFSALTHPTDGYSHAALLADLDGDGVLDLVSGHSFGYNINVSIGNGDGTFQAANRHIVSLDVAADDPIVNDLAAADFDGDSRLDVVVAMNRGLNVMWGHDNWGTTQHRPITEAGEHRFVATGDYDGDGQIDVVASMYNTNSNFRAYFGSIPGTCQ